MCSSKPICAVLKTEMCSHHINKNVTSKDKIQMPEMLSLGITNLMFSGRGSPEPHIFLTNHIRAGVMEQEVKLGRAKLSKRD
jgi:hypothetical protein